MRLCVLAFCAIGLAGIEVARADHLPVLVVPGRPDVPVIIDGVDASWGVVEGDWGLYRPGATTVTVIPAPNADPIRRGNGYFPSFGHVPRAGRLEVEPPPNRVLPPQAESYHRAWGAASDPAPATIPSDPPPVIVAPPYAYGDGDRNRRRPRRNHHH